MLRTKLDRVLPKKLIKLAVPVALILGAATVVAPAHASSAADHGTVWRSAAPITVLSVTTRIRHWQSGKCLDGSVSQGVRLKDCNGDDYQKWTISSNTRAPITHFQSGRCLDGSISQGVRLNTCNGNIYQLWDYPHP